MENSSRLFDLDTLLGAYRAQVQWLEALPDATFEVVDPGRLDPIPVPVSVRSRVIA